MARTVTIDGEAHDLDIVRGLTVSPAGVIVAPLVKEHALRFFDAKGKDLGSFGRTGDGPGEFRMLGDGTNGWIGDTLWVYDVALRRISLVSPGRKLLRIVAVPGSVTSPTNPKLITAATLMAMPSAQSLLFSTSPARAVPSWIATPPRTRGSFLRTDAAGRLLTVVGAEPRRDDPCERQTGDAQARLPLCPRHLAAVSPDGKRIVFAAPVAATQFRLTALNPAGGDTIFSKVISQEATSIPGQVRDSLRDELATQVRLEPELARYYAGLTPPKVFPPFSALLVGRDGSIWLNDGQSVLGRQRWRILDAAGSLVRTVELPLTAHVQSVSAREAWVTEPGPNGFVNIAKYTARP
jgi:hypothetical protein